MSTLLLGGFLHGCDLGWDFLQEGGSGGGDAGAQTGCQSSRIAVGQLPSAGGLSEPSFFSADYSSASRSLEGAIPTKGMGLRLSRHRLWVNDLTIEVSFFPFDDTTRDPRNGCLGRAILEINIPAERLFFDDRTIDIASTLLSLTEPSAFYAEGGDPGFTANAVNGTVRLRSVDESRVDVFFDFTFNPGADQRLLRNGEIADDIDQNPAVEGLQSG
jgi:hypothetical protein